jgi:sugar phosphate permease
VSSPIVAPQSGDADDTMVAPPDSKYHTMVEKPGFKKDLYEFWLDVKEVLGNKYFFWCLCGSIANNFALGGLADWFPSFLYRYNHVSISNAGVVVGAATILGGIGGNFLGAKTTLRYEKALKNAYMSISAMFTVPAAFFLLILINVHSTAVAITFLMLAEICVWTCLAPITTVSISCIPAPLRAVSCGLTIFLQHILGDMISPPIIGAISDSTGSLQKGLQITWIMVAVSGASWAWGAFSLPNFDIPVELSGAERPGDKETTYYELLFVSSPHPSPVESAIQQLSQSFSDIDEAQLEMNTIRMERAI